MNTLIDTSAWIEALRVKGNEEIRNTVKLLLQSGEARISEPILLELFHGARGKKELGAIKDLKESVPILKCSEDVYNKSYEFAVKLRSKGFTLPSIDILIYSTAKYFNVPLFHNDSDFKFMEKVEF
ncbi:MAG: PIN domain-containing protein [Leptospiraceae bacterium]|nr:PIN domain-containing protein [Leptospiraceae bacterium]